jgi:N-acyl amino acid synthase FeeM
VHLQTERPWHNETDASPEPMASLVLDQGDPPWIHEFADRHRTFRIRQASTAGHRSTVALLVDKMYAWRSYGAAGSSYHLTHDPNRIALVISDQDHAIATATLGLDSEIGLLADDLYPEESRRLRSEGRRLCEMTKLAVERLVRSKRVLASLFHISLIYARHLHGCTDCLIEINPRHVRFYETMLGFEALGGLKLCRRVGAPARLLRLDIDAADAKIAAFGGNVAGFPGERSLYPYFFSKAEEAGILGRLKALH